MTGIAMTRKYRHGMPPLLQAYGGVNDQALRSTDAKVRMDEDNLLGLGLVVVVFGFGHE